MKDRFDVEMQARQDALDAKEELMNAKFLELDLDIKRREVQISEDVKLLIDQKKLIDAQFSVINTRTDPSKVLQNYSSSNNGVRERAVDGIGGGWRSHDENLSASQGNVRASNGISQSIHNPQNNFGFDNTAGAFASSCQEASLRRVLQ